MWKKDDIPAPAPAGSRPEEGTRRPVTPQGSRPSGEMATIGRSIVIKGEVTGDEDILIQGRVDGSVTLKQQSVTVGPEGRVKANITGRNVIVEGEVEGNLKAEDQVLLRSTARVQGDISASRLVLEDGAVFRGGVEMGDPKEKGPQAAAPQGVPKKESPEPAKGESTKPTLGAGTAGAASSEKATP